MELVKLLSSLELFQGLDADQLTQLAAISEREAYPIDQIVFKQGSHGDRMYIVAEGQVEIRFADSKGDDHPVLFLGQGQIFGEMALLDQGTRSATVVAAQDGTVVYTIPQASFIQLCDQNMTIGYKMMRNIALDLSFKLRHKNLDPSTSF
jgi:CRP/FNR family cyclic AMP-dependent transcriptional regulator